MENLELTQQEKFEKLLEAYSLLKDYVSDMHDYYFVDSAANQEIITYTNELFKQATK